jgi:hypothetical protein
VPVPVPVPVAPASPPSPRAGDGEVEVDVASMAHVVTVTSTPAGATVRRGGEVIGATPLELALDDGVTTQTLTLEAPGHRAREIVVGRDRDAVDVVLERASRGGGGRKSARPPRAGAAQLGVEEW